MATEESSAYGTDDTSIPIATAVVAMPVAANHGHHITADAVTSHTFPEEEQAPRNQRQVVMDMDMEYRNRSLPQRDRCHISYL